MAHQTPYLDSELLLEKYNSAKKRLMLFDYDVSDSGFPSSDLLL